MRGRVRAARGAGVAVGPGDGAARAEQVRERRASARRGGAQGCGWEERGRETIAQVCRWGKACLGLRSPLTGVLTTRRRGGSREDHPEAGASLPSCASVVASPPVTARNQLLADLQRVYGEGKLVVFVGAGVSAAGGLPGWKGLAERLLGLVDRGTVAAGAVEEIEAHITANQLNLALSGLELALGPVAFADAIRRELDDRGRPIPEIAKAIAALKPKLRAVLTTNLDRFLERAFEGDWRDTTAPTADIATDDRYIWKLHGTLNERETWVFTRGEYEQLIFASPAHRAAFEAMYRACPILFVGYGLVDDDLDMTLGAMRAHARGQPPKHFAIVPRPVRPLRKRMLEEAGVRPIEYDNHDGRHEEVLQIIRELAAPPAPPRP